MAALEEEDVPMLSDMYPQVDEHDESQLRRLSSRNRSISMSNSWNSREPYEYQNNLVGRTGPLRNARRTDFIQMSGPLYVGLKHENIFQPTQAAIGHQGTEPSMDKDSSFRGMGQDGWPDNYAGRIEHLLKSGKLGICDDPYSTTCPTFYNTKGKQNMINSGILGPKFRNVLYGDAKGWARRFYSFLHPYIPGVINPHTKVVQEWNKFFAISCLVAIFLDPLFFLLLSVQQRVNQCLRDACHHSGLGTCMKFIDCGHGTIIEDFKAETTWNKWTRNANASACFGQRGFSYGIYGQAVKLTTERSLITRYIYSLFWGFQQISTLAGNQTPSYFVWEVLFTMAIIGLGLLLFALLIGNMQNFLQALGRG